MREELYRIAKEVSHDIASPVSSLKIIEELYDRKLSDKDKKMLKSTITSIENMAGKMLSKYRLNEQIEKGKIEEVEENEQETYICLSESLADILENARYRKKEEEVEIKYEIDTGDKLVFIRGDNADFKRMMINIINNGIEAAQWKKAEIEVSYEIKGEEVEIRIKDNGKGMPKEMAEKLMKEEEIGTTKKEGHGIGMQQIMGTIKVMNGKLKVDSKEGEGTEFILTFLKTEKPKLEVKR
jgi:signal transduction histidine kinase